VNVRLGRGIRLFPPNYESHGELSKGYSKD
jgi:hypothetical protein